MNNDKRTLYVRAAGLTFLLLLISGIFLWLSYRNIVVNAIEPNTATAGSAYYTDKIIPASRGDMTDRYGNVLVTNRVQYNALLRFDIGKDVDVEEQVDTVLRLMEVCRQLKVKWNDNELPISQKAPYAFTVEGNPFVIQGSNGKYSSSRLYRLCKKVADEACGDNGRRAWTYRSTISAPELVTNMYSFFGLDKRDDLSEADKRSALGILYSAYLRSGTDQVLWTDYYFAEDVDIDFITIVTEENLTGIEITTVAAREFKTKSAAHLLGQVGPISAEKWAQLKENPDNDYNMNDYIGLSGAEAAFEPYLRGISGIERTYYDSNGNVVAIDYPKKPQAGKNVAYTLDLGLQEVVEKALADWTDVRHLDPLGGSAAVVLDAKDSSILAIASYPTFDPANYTKDYKELSTDERLPLFNRALQGVYAPGSTYKICSATAAASSPKNRYGTDTSWNCTGKFSWNNDGKNEQRCWYRSGHGWENMSEAIKDSCNVYFYNVGKDIGIDYLTKVAREYGLGVPSGIEIAENKGINAGPEFAASIPGGVWYPGNVTSAAIGQSDNQFTVLQIANYIAAFTRGGKRLDAHLLNTVKSSDNSQLVYQHESQVLSSTTLEKDTQKAITKGMGEVIAIDEITGFEDLEKRGIKVGCKTGTAELGKTKTYNGLFVSFAPINDPQIVICTVMEKADYGADTAIITSDIMNYYFSEKATQERAESENQLLR